MAEGLDLAAQGVQAVLDYLAIHREDQAPECRGACDGAAELAATAMATVSALIATAEAASAVDKWPEYHLATPSGDLVVLQVGKQVSGISVGDGISYQAVDGRIFADPAHVTALKRSGVIVEKRTIPEND